MNDVLQAVNGQAERRVSGWKVVVGMFLFGGLVTSMMALYWTLNSAPFRPLQRALAEHFPGSVPRVEGGQHKLDATSPRILRVVLRVRFDPEREPSRGEQVLKQVTDLAARYVDLNQYDTLQLFLFEGIPEKSIKTKEFDLDLRPNEHKETRPARRFG